jgi:hypothetical protein
MAEVPATSSRGSPSKASYSRPVLELLGNMAETNEKCFGQKCGSGPAPQAPVTTEASKRGGKIESSQVVSADRREEAPKEEVPRKPSRRVHRRR